jgi:2-alkyl-3-oxoalkanoate reductase
MQILVTGGGGFVGQAVIRRLLARGDSVRSFGRSPQPDLAAAGVDVVCGDLANAAEVREAAKGVDAVLHVAAKAGIWGSWESYHTPNVVGTRNVVAACQAEGVERLVHTSTPSVVFNGKPIRGDGPEMPYGQIGRAHV